ncbi:MAG: tetratricopeptide repeat protein, partial [Armatimonadetes bacterium]|nr:tetratricopeptide repeat protein [Armatimonadota bacterium]
RFESIGKLAPGSEPAFAVRRQMVMALQQLKRTDEALALLARAEQQQPEASAVAAIVELRAEVLEESGRWTEAVTALDELVRRYPGSYLAAQATQRQIDLLREHDDLPGAIARLKALQPTLSGPYWEVQTQRELLGLYRAAKQHDQAEDTAAALLKLTEGTPVGADALLQMARAQREAGRKKAARQSLEKLVQTYKGGPVVPMAEALLATWETEDKAAP